MFGFIKKHKQVAIILGGLVGLAVIGLALTLMLGGNRKLSFTDDMIKECVVNESCNISNYVNNPQGKTLKLTATYKDEFGLEMECMVAGLAFKPTEITKVNLKVEAEDGETIEAVVQVVQAAPSLVTTNEAIYYLDQTIQLSELKEHVVYTSHSDPEFEVMSVECGTEKEELKGKKEYTFKEVGAYTFTFNLSNPTGNVEGFINVKVKPELTENELYDMTNNSYVNAGSQATLSLNREQHAKNSDWSWAVKANPAGIWKEEGGSYYIQTIMIDFGMEIDASKLYFTMDLLANENTAGICIHYTNGAGQVASGPMGFQDVLGEWTTVSSKGLVSEGIYSGIYILVLHKMEGEYDASNVVALIDNLYLHEWDPNAPIIVGGTEDYAIKDGVIAWNSTLKDNGVSGNYVQFNKQYKNETLTFTMPIEDAKNPGLALGARMDGAKVNYAACQGLLIKFYDEFFEVYAPGYGQWVGAYNVVFKSGERYTFSYSVESASGKDMLYLKIQEASAGTIIVDYELELPKNVVAVSGYMVIWSSSQKMAIEYKEPVVITRKSNVNVTVDKNGKAGTASLSSASPGNLAKAAYLAMKGDYTNETFAFSTKIQDATSPNLVIGARVEGVSTGPSAYKGLTIRLYDKFIEVYGPDYGAIIGAAELSLKSGETYDFAIDVVTKDGVSKLTLVVKQGNTVILNYILKDIKAKLPASGNFMVWTLSETTEIAYSMPSHVEKVENKNIIVEKTGQAGTVELKTVMPNNLTAASYLAMKGDYTNETFTFTTKIEAAAGPTIPQLMLGARMTGIGEDPFTYEGIMISVYEGFIEVYAPSYGAWIDATSLSLTAGETYTFSIQVDTESGANTLYFVVKQGDNQILSYKLPNIATSIPEIGGFIVWNLNPTRSISYEMPKYIEQPQQPVNQNAIVESTGTAGTAVLKTVIPNDAGASSYLAMKGTYTNEVFEFTTKIADVANPNLLIGAHMAGVDAYAATHRGFTMRIYEGFFEAFGTTYLDYAAYKADTLALSADVEYTFCIKVIDKKTVHLTITSSAGTVYDKDIVFDTEVLPESGHFMVWNLDTERTVSYKMPESQAVVPTENQNVVVESNGTAGTAVLKTVTPNNPGVSSYLAVKGSYTNEIFEFTTKITDAANPNLLIGAHMADVDTYAGTHSGFTLRFYEGFFEAFGTTYLDYTAYKADSISLSANVEYTFQIQVIDKKTLHLTVSSSAGVLYDKDIVFDTEVIPTNGNFMVWNMDAERSITYKMPESVQEQPKENQNVVVETTSVDGTATLKTVTPNDVSVSSYLALKGAYTDEVFEFTTKIADVAKPNLLIGAHMAGVASYAGAQNGFVLQFHNGFFEAFSTAYLDYTSYKADTLALSANVEYTFRIQVIDKKTVHLTVTSSAGVVYDKDIVFDTEVIPASGNFMVWNMDAERIVTYKMPTSNVVSGNALTATEASGNILLTAPAGTGSVENLSYIVSASEYSDKTFEVTMNVAQGEDPYFIMGARVKGCQYYPSIWGVNTSGGQGGVLVEIHNNFYTIHAPGFLQKLSEKNYTGGIVLEGQYTFGVKVTTVSGTSQILFTVKQGDTLVHSETINTDVAIPAIGNFVAWAQKEQAFKYKISE